MHDGRKCYLAYRKTGEIFRSGEKSISDAVRKGIACWAVDEETLIQMRAQSIKFIGVLVRDTEDLYLTRIEYFFDTKRAKVLNYETRNGSLQRYLPLEYFRKRSGYVHI